GDLAIAIDVGVGVDVRRRAVRRPTRVRDTAGPAHGVAREEIDEAGNSPGELASLDASLILQRHTRRVVAAVLQTREALEQDRRGLARPDVTHDAAHAESLLQDWGPA